MNAKKRALGRIVALALALLLHASATPAQQPGGSLRGQVVDPAGAVIQGASVTLTDAAGKDRTTTTNSEGVYTIAALPPGTYSVTAAAKGFAPLQGMSVEITSGSRKTLDLKLEVTVSEQVDVTTGGSRLSVEPETTNSGLVLSGEDLKVLSDDPDLLMEDLRALAGPGFGPNGTQFYVDGFSGGRLPPKTSIREVRINQNPFAAEQDSLGFGRVEIFTKPGSEQFNGQVYMFFSDESLNARNPLVTTKPPFQVRLFGANLSGPISKKASFFLDLERREIDENAFVSAIVLNPSLVLTPFSEGVVTPQRRTNLSGRVDYQLNKNHTLVARYGFLDVKLDNQGVGGFALPSVGFDSKLREQTLQLTETAIVNPRVLNETRFQFVHSRGSKQGDDSSPTIQVQGAFIGGGVQVGPSFNDSNRYELNNVTMWSGGTHTVRFGGRFRLADFTDVDRSSYNGAYIFSSPEQYRRVLAGVPGASPAQLFINGGNPLAHVNQSDLGLFLQDDWRMRPNFTLSYGLRFETQTDIKDHADFAPRVSFAWGLGATKQNAPKTVIRGGGGVFYYRFGDDLTLQAERFDGLHQQQLIITNPTFFPVIPPFDTLTGSNEPTVRRIAPDLRTPYTVTEAIGVERQLPRSMTISLTYVHQDSFHLLRSRNINAPLPGTFIPGLPSSGVHPLGDVGNIFQFESSGRSKSDGLVVNFRGRLASHVMMFATSRFYRERNDTDGPYNFPANSFDTSGEFGYGLNDVRAATFIGSNIVLPWKLTMSPFVRATTGTRFNIITGRDTNGDTVFTERPAFATDLSKPGVVVTDFGAFDPNPAPGQQLIPRNYGRAPGYFNINVRFGRTFSFGTARSNATSAASQQTGPQPTPQGGAQPSARDRARPERQIRSHTFVSGAEPTESHEPRPHHRQLKLTFVRTVEHAGRHAASL